MEAVILVGLQAAGKSTFYREQFSSTHVRMNLDMLRTRHRERRFLEPCIETRQPFVLDNTNLTIVERQVSIGFAKNAGFRVKGYYFQSKVEDCKRRNELRTVEERVPLKGTSRGGGQNGNPQKGRGFRRTVLRQDRRA